MTPLLERKREFRIEEENNRHKLVLLRSAISVNLLQFLCEENWGKGTFSRSSPPYIYTLLYILAIKSDRSSLLATLHVLCHNPISNKVKEIYKKVCNVTSTKFPLGVLRDATIITNGSNWKGGSIWVPSI